MICVTCFLPLRKTMNLFIILLLVIIPVLSLLKLLTRNHNTNAKNPPEPPGAWPIIGHLPLLGSPVHLAHTLAHLADKHGPIFSLRLGMQRVVVISSREAVMECFTTNDKSFANRPKTSAAGEHLVYDNASFGFANGPYWRETRKLVMAEVLSPRRLEAMRDLRVTEIETSVRELYLETREQRPGMVSISRWVDQVALNIIVKTIAGKRYGKGEVEPFRNLFRELTFLSGEFVLSDVIPFRLLKWMDAHGQVVKRMKYVAKELDGIILGWIQEHVAKRQKSGGGDEDKDFIDVLLSTIDHRFDKFGVERITIIKATVVNVVLGGFDTTSVFVTWLLTLLVNHKNVMKLAQEELDTKVGKQKWVQELDIKNLPYLQAVIKEALRLYPPLPLSIPHEAVEDCKLGGYHIAKDTLVFVNLHKLHRDPRFWEEPERFLPERFLMRHEHVDVIGQQFEFTPFGAGRRSCPGTTFAMQVTSLMVARLIQGFDFVPPGNGLVDMEEGVGITMPRENPLEVMISPRLDSQLY